MNDLELYGRYFAAGMKVGAGIPMPDGGVFRDWALIHEVDEDLVSLQLSRDQLPEGVGLHVGQIIDLRGGKEGSGYSCRAIIVSEGEAHEILLRLIGEIVTDELREFYRIDAFLPIKYYITAEQHPDLLREEWALSRQRRQDEELSRRQQRWESSFAASSSGLPDERHQAAEEFDPSWDTIVPLAANISGGGLRIVVHEPFQPGQYVPLEILVPSPQSIVEAVGQVVFSHLNAALPGDRDSYSVALKFVFIDERDRDLIARHIANVQLKRIRQLRERFALRDGLDLLNEEQARSVSRGDLFRRGLVATLFVVIVILLAVYLHSYSVYHPKGEIEETFESGIRKYIENLKK